MEKVKLELIIEKGEQGLWGRVSYNDNLIVEQADTLDQLELRIKTIVNELEALAIENIIFEIRYDVYALFEQFDFLNISKVAKRADINPGLLRQYASGVKHPSLIQARKIEETLHRLADQMQKASVYGLT